MESLDEFQHQLSVLRGGILEYARSPSAVFPSLQFLDDFKRDDARLTAEISAARDRISKAPAARDAYFSARPRFDAARTEYEGAQKSLQSLYKPLGAAAYAAFKAGEIPRQQQFAERMDLDERIARLKTDQNALGASPVSGVIGKTKAKAKQLAVAARIMFANLSARKLEGQIGKALIDAQSEDSVRSASTAEVLDDVASVRRDIASCKRDFDLAANALESAKTALIQSLGVSSIDTDAAIAERLDALRWELTATQLRLPHTEDKFLDSLVSNAGSFAETPIGPALARLAQLRAEAAEARAAEVQRVAQARATEVQRTKELSERRKLVPCKACGREISSEADACIHCGQPMNTAIKCPNCKSRDVIKISAASKVGSVVLFGVFSMGKLTKTYQCKACGFRW
jgi:hypothetical protein